MATVFLSRVERNSAPTSYSDVGPGSYVPGSSLRKSLPGFAPFSSTSKRMNMKGGESPPPSSYNVSEDLLKKTAVKSAFKSKTERFKDKKTDREPGPGSYPIKSAFTIKKKSGPPRPVSPNSMLQPAQVAPSIPTRHQSYGYETAADGRIVPQEPIQPGYSGIMRDSVGPGDYDPKIDVKFKKSGTSTFSKNAARDAADKMRARATEAPGPGYYNAVSEFDKIAGITNNYDDTNFIMHLTATRKRQSSVFESKTGRDSFLEGVKKREKDPGPGDYNLPTSIHVEAKPVNQQFFTSSDIRFKDPTARSLRLQTAPGTYQPLTSDFDKLRLKILKQKKMVSRSGWAKNIAFLGTDTRFRSEKEVNGVPPPSTYHPKTSFADNVPKQNVRAGAFGMKDQRFKEPKSNHEPSRDPFKRAAGELNREVANYLAHPDNAGLSHSMSPKQRGGKPTFTSAFAPKDNSRNRPARTPPGPAPGTYDVQPKWEKGSLVMAPIIVNKKKQLEDLPGPGQYNIPRRFGAVARNPKNIMFSTSPRSDVTGGKKKQMGPGPGQYDVRGSLIRPSHNVLLSDEYY